MIVLVVDDEQDIKILFEQRFRKEIKQGQIFFKFVFSGEEALRYIKSSETDKIVLVLSDINMPGMNGLELLKEVKSDFPGLKVVMITAYGDETNYNQAVKFGCDDYFTKPIDFSVLKTKVLQHI